MSILKLLFTPASLVNQVCELRAQKYGLVYFTWSNVGLVIFNKYSKIIE